METHCQRCFELFSPYLGHSDGLIAASHSACAGVPGAASSKPNQPKYKTRKERKRELNRFNKRRRTLFFKADELRRDCDSDIYIVVRKENRYYTYSSASLGVGSWPLSERQMSEIYPIPQRFDPVKMEELRSRPKTKTKATREMERARGLAREPE